jgi:hypothetical protein
MTIAEIHGKLPEYEGMEDLLTLKYVLKRATSFLLSMICLSNMVGILLGEMV